MNQKSTNILRGRPWLMLLLLFAWLLPQQLTAANRSVDKTYLYQVMLSGSNTITIKAPIYDEDLDDHWVSNGNLKAKWKDKNEKEHSQTVFYWAWDRDRENKSHNNSSSTLYTKFKASIDGNFTITPGNTSNTFTLTQDQGESSQTVYENKDETYDFTAVWMVPYEMLGCEVTFEWDVKADYTTGIVNSEYQIKGLTSTTVTIPPAVATVDPQVTMATMSFSQPGMLEVPWFMASDNITSARYEYTDQYGNLVKENLQTSNGNGIIYLDASVPHKNFRVVVDYMNGDYPIKNVGSQVQDLQMIHVPRNLSAKALGDHKASVQLDWNIEYPTTEDIATYDFFDIQRSLTGKEEDFESISAEPFVPDTLNLHYTFVDSTLVEALQESYLKNGGTLENLTYRVRRAMTEHWGWDNTCTSTASCVVDGIHLLSIATYSSKWEDKDAFTARVTWEYDEKDNAVWDDRAKMMLRVTMTNAQGETVDVQSFELTPQERAQRYKVIDLSRTCINYKVELYVDRGTSPVNLSENVEPFWFPIRNADDWKEFRNRVQVANGQYDVNARLYADFTTGECISWESRYAYRGTFDGNGHTITFNLADVGQQYAAPFRYVGNATFRNLHTAGTVSNSQKFASGLIGRVADGTTVTVENCRSSMNLKSTVSGDGTNGGFVCVVGNNAGATFRNCKFDGSFEGANCDSNGGFVGWTYSPITVDNCLFAPSKYEMKVKGSTTWARHDDRGSVTLVNSHAATEFSDQVKSIVIDGKTFMVLHNNDDWLNFRNAVNNNPNTNAILAADFTVHNAIALDAGTVFSGIFDGNGHTLNADMYGGNGMGIALFVNARDYTIKNLHLTGKITGGDHLAGLVGISARSGAVACKILNCRISTTLESSGWIAGGVVGRGNGADIVNCLFDGYIGCSKSKDGTQWWIGSFYGFLDGDLNGAVQCCVENGSYKSDIEHKLLNINGSMTSWGNGANQWSYNNFSYNGFSSSFNASAVSNDYIREKLGTDNWELVDGKWLPKMATTEIIGVVTRPLSEIESYFISGWTKEGNTINPVTTTINEEGGKTYPAPTQENFYHEGNGEIGKTLMAETRQSSVVLTWAVDGVVDYFQVYRRLANSNATWDRIADQIDQTGYEDKSVSPLQDYEYKVRAVTDCEGMHYSETDVRQGACLHTARVDGYVRFDDGTGVPGIDVQIKYNNSPVKTVQTDEKGYFMADGLSYYGSASAKYEVTPVGSGNIKIEDGKETYAVTFNNESNDETTWDFIITSSHRFSGFVMYDGTSIPVKGAHFKVDGRDVYNATGGHVETAFDGSFSFRVLDGQHTIQTVMDKHVFTNDGYYKSSAAQNINKDVSQIYFYDATKVKLIGRVVGGDDQGSLPLDNNLSRNNLGDNLTMVLTLEGDNTSWLVYDNLNPEQTKREETFAHAGGNGHQTNVVTERKRMTVKPDSVTGEYTLMLPPVRWKVQQVYCEGYPTLFQEGQVSEVIDLTECLTAKNVTYDGSYKDVDGRVAQRSASYNAIYNRIYHSPVEITYKQLGYDSFDYFGDKSYTSVSVGTEKVEVPLASEDKASEGGVHYTFGHPVFSLNRRYPILLQVAERYVYNNDTRTGKVDMVKIGGGKVTVHNGMKNNPTPEVIELDDQGQGRFYLTADQTVRLLTGDDALKTVTMTLEQDGSNYEAEPLKAYTLNMFALGGPKDVLVNGQPLLVDILRDPPGGGSTATLSKGSKLKYSYTLDMSAKAGLHLEFIYGTHMENFKGIVAAPDGVGTANGIINSSDVEKAFEKDVTYDIEGHRGFSYTINVNQDITTSSDPMMVGADADLYIGMVQNIVVQTMSTIRAIPDDIFQQMKGRLGNANMAGISNQYGTLVEIAEGTDTKGNKFHLVRDESLGYGPEVTSQFIHSQKHLLTQLIPEKVKELRALMFTGSAAEAQAKADATGKPVYRSLVPEDDENFGVLNEKDGEAYYYTSKMAEEPGMNYVIHLPSNATSMFDDEVAEKCQIIYAWTEMIANNEREKYAATGYPPIANYDVDGGSKVTYSETFESEYTNSNYSHMPVVKTANYYDTSGVDMAWTVSTMVGAPILSKISKMIFQKNLDKNIKPKALDNRYTIYGTALKFRVLPIGDYQVKDVSSESKSYSRKESFNIVMDKKSHLDFDVYHAKTDTASVKTTGIFDVFTNQNFEGMTTYVEKYIKRGNTMKDAMYSRGFVYRTRGGATVNPWEDERKTIFYNAGRVFDERTKKIQNPQISLDRQSVSGVAMGEPARFKVYLTNDSEQPEAGTGGISIYTFYMDENSNPDGAKIMVDGIALTSSGWDVQLTPGQVTQKTIEVYAGNAFDYEGLKIGIKSRTDEDHINEKVAFDVHYLRQAGPVNIMSPGDKWVMNTDAEADSKRGWYIPVTIDGFDRHQHNFDHIEFQYKETQRGDEYWTNLCSYYADSLLMEKSNGEREMIPENGNIVTNFYGEGTVMEKAYDLRAVLYCRNGNSFLTTSSKVISGVKDTRRPQLFGTPEPTTGLLTPGDNIVFNFSEDIEYNYLSAITNFEVKGETNNDHISEAVSVEFKDKASVETEAKRNFSGKSLTIDLMVKPDETGREMPIFSHGTNGKKLQLWVTGDFKLKAVIDDNVYVSDDAIVRGAFTQVALTIDQENDVLAFYNGGKLIGQKKLEAHYNGTGKLIFGRTNENDRMDSKYYAGRMKEARLWYRAMDGGLIGTTYGGRRLTGYETGLVDYYPMNEGSGKYVTDHTQGANAQLMGADWAVPRGYSLRLTNDDHGFKLTNNALNRTKEQDYTLMFWFKTDREGRGVLVSNGAGSKQEIGAANIFNIAFEAEKLMFRSNGQAVQVPGDWSDGDWHHFAMTVNRGLNVANIYVDKEQRTTFAADSLGGISGGHPLLGAALYEQLNASGEVVAIDTRNWLTGYIDEFCFFAQALPQTLISTYASKSPNGDEAGLLAYLSFDRQERQKDNSIEMVAYPYSKKIYKDKDGNMRYQLDPLTQEPTKTPVRDYLFVDNADKILSHITNGTAAPVLPYEELENLKFSFVGEGHRLLVNLNESNAKLNRRNLYVTVRDIEDKHGNAMASPQTACYYVSNSSLQWLVNRLDATIKYGSGESCELPFYNNGASNHTYKIENCPKWLTLNKFDGVMAPQSLDYVTATASKDLNIGTYNEIIYLTDEEGITEPFYLNLTVEGEQPDWAGNVNGELLRHSMSISGQVYIYDELDTDTRDIVGVFDDENQCHGFANISHDATTGENGLFLSVYDNETSGRALNFRLWQYSTGREIVLKPSQTITFDQSAALGTDNPIRFNGGDDFVQNFDLKKGWNWVSFNVSSGKLFDLNSLLSGMSWNEGDIITDLNSGLVLTYKNKQWLSSDSVTNVVISPKRSYAIKVQEDCTFPVSGTVIKNKDQRTIKLKHGWNGIGYTPVTNLTVETALSDYYDHAESGDVIKSHTEFAYFTKTGNTGRWRGSLQYLKPGEGYMLLRTKDSDASFAYPFIEPSSNFREDGTTGTRRNVAAQSPSTMTVSATVEGFDLEDGDVLVAYSNGEAVGEAIAVSDSHADSREPLYLSIAGNSKQPIWFAIEREGEIVASTGQVMTFATNAVVGTPDEPTAINFVRTAYEDGYWYTTNGQKLQRKPTRKGIYIYNGNKIVIK